MDKQIGHFIAGQLTPGKDGALAKVFDPALGEASTVVCLANQSQTSAAIDAASAALPQWMATPPLQRARIMQSFSVLLREHSEEIALAITSEHGKTIADAKGELQRGIEVVDFACGIPELLKGDFSKSVSSSVDCHDLRQAVGVCAGITPFNFPAMVPLWMFPVAICCGNTFVLKPSEKDPSCPLRLAELMQQAGLPDGVLNVINGDQTAVDTILHDDRVAAVSFVGSTLVGEKIYRTASNNGKRVQALCGAKNHMLVLPDADLKQAANAAIAAAYGSAGERCMAISVVVTTDDRTADSLVDAICSGIDALKIGSGKNPDTDMGPVIDKAALDKVTRYIDQGVAAGAELVRDGRTAKLPTAGFFIGASLFDRVQPGMSIYLDEIFGPVLCLVRCDGYENALQVVNGHDYGNGAAIFTQNGNLAHNFCNNVQAGMVGVNVPIPVPPAFHSFGGWKKSMLGDHAMHGKEGVRFYTRLKTISSRWGSSQHSKQFHFKGAGDS